MSVPPAPTRAAASRRTALGGALAGLVVLTGCDDGDSSSDGPAVGPSTGATPPSDTPDDPDAALVDQVATQISTALGAVVGVRSASPKLGPTLRPLVRLHRTHLDALEAEEQDSESPAGDGGLDAVRAAETRLQRQLTDAAVAAESGALAKLLASMAAAIAQRLAVLPA